jgi:phospholipase C
MWLACACSPRWEHAPADAVIQVARNGTVIKDGIVTPDGYAVNSFEGHRAYPAYKPYPTEASDPTRRLPPQMALTIGDRLNERNISWRWYAGGYDDALAGNPDRLFQFDHQPFAYFAKYADGTPEKAEFLKDGKAFYEDLKTGTLPAVSFLKLSGSDDEHPGYTSVIRGQERVADIVRLVQQGPYWSKVAVFIVYAGNGGRWDHVAPPKGDRWGPGTRVPAIVVSPFAKKHYVDHTIYDTTSLLAFIERRWNLRPIASRDAQANDLTNAFEFGR